MCVNDLKTAKEDLREKYKAVRKGIPSQRRREMDADIQSRLLSLNQYSRQEWILTYVSKDDLEVDTVALIAAALANHKRVAVPRCVPDRVELEFYRIRGLDDLSPGTFGVLEPDPGRCERIERPYTGLCIVPGLSFDAGGFRLGYGKGYYDRFLSQFEGTSVGLCYSNCMQWRLPRDEYDRPVHYLITEQYVRNTRCAE